jgi:cobalt-zinc-cadmium resistance protein CzcA
MIGRIVRLALEFKWVVLLIALAVISGGIAAYRELDIEAYPNPVPPLVEVIAQPRGWSSEEVERYVTIPLEVALFGIPGLDHLRSQSVFGLSDVKCYFRWGTDYTAARQEVLNRLAMIQLPAGVQPQISPWNAIGELFRYTLRGQDYSLSELKTAQDWILERQFRQVPGVIDVVGFGGETKQYQVSVDPMRMRGLGVTLAQLENALKSANINVGGERLVMGEQTYDVRGIGLIKGTQDIENVVVAERDGTPVRVRDLAEVSIGHAPRLGQVGKDDDDDVVQGIVLMRYGAETAPTLEGIHQKMNEIRGHKLLPPGMEIVPYYDRGELVKLTTRTVTENLLIGMLLVTAVLFVFLGHARAALITAVNIPLSLLIAFGGMVVTGTPANLISLGAVDFGIVIDSTVIMMENVFRHLGRAGPGSVLERIQAGAREVGSPMLFSTLILAVAFIPLFTISGVAGVIFTPLAHTYALAIGGACLLAISLTPALSLQFMSIAPAERESPVMQVLERIYAPWSRAAMRHPNWNLGLVLLLVGVGGGLASLLGGEFMPKLEEGNFWIRATLPTSVSMDESSKIAHRARRILRGCPQDPGLGCDASSRKFPEVETVVSQLGRPDDGTDVTSVANVEFYVPLKPSGDWRKGVNKQSLLNELNQALERDFVGIDFAFSQVISDNVEEALTGVKGENSVKVFGPDIGLNEAKALAITQTLDRVRGIEDTSVLRSLGQPNVKITVDRLACARYGINTGDVESVVEAAVGGRADTSVFEGEKQFDLVVRWLAQYRSSVDAIRSITVASAEGVQIPLGELAEIKVEEGPSIIYREDGQRYTPIKFAVRGRDLASAVGEAESAVMAKVNLPYDMHLEWAGQMSQLADALGRLGVMIPVTLALIALLAYAAVKNWVDTLIVLWGIPVAGTGGVIALLATGTTFSISAAMGFVSIFGIAMQDAILVVTYFQRLRQDGRLTVADAAREAGEKGFRPALMITLVAMLGLLPAALSTRIGSQTQKPLALVVIGGSLMLALTSRITRPALLLLAHGWLERWRDRRAARRPPDAGA